MTRLLIIDDDPAIALLLHRTLTRSDYQVLIASNGQEGLAKAQDYQPALIICDWLMPPGIDGLEVCRSVKANPELATTFFILLTSLGSVADRVKGLDAGADDFLCKPIELSELLARVKAGLRLHQLSQDLTEQKQLLEAELAEAADYVCSILPEPLVQASFTIDSHFIPSRQLGGDGFDYFSLDGDRLAFYLLDVAGHGLRAALPALSVINLLRSQGLNQVDYGCPSQVLSGLNRSFQMSDRQDKYFTMWYGVYDRKQGKLTYASAGHPPAILLQPQEKEWQVKALKTRGFPIGMFTVAQYVDNVCSIVPQSSLYLFSDGLYEIEQSDHSILGLPKLIELLKSYRSSNMNNLQLFIELMKRLNLYDQFEDDLSILQINFS
jgi:sigma-B regulation protein RsbU (phosphoserine phosphatase)